MKALSWAGRPQRGHQGLAWASSTGSLPSHWQKGQAKSQEGFGEATGGCRVPAHKGLPGWVERPLSPSSPSPLNKGARLGGSMAGGDYERELKAILRGERDVLDRLTRTWAPQEREGYLQALERPFVVVRAAGSLGIDLVAIRGDLAFPIEVKASSNETVWLSKTRRTILQAQELMEESRRAEVLPIYAYRLKSHRGDPWRVFTVDVVEVRGRIRMLQSSLPKVKVSRGGHFILEWEEGMPLHRFIPYLSPRVAPALPA